MKLSETKIVAVARAITETWSSHFGDGKPYDELDHLTRTCRYAEAKAAIEAYEKVEVGDIRARLERCETVLRKLIGEYGPSPIDSYVLFTRCRAEARRALENSQAAVLAAPDTTDADVERALKAFQEKSKEWRPCKRCKGRGYHHGFGEDGHDPDWCLSCGGSQYEFPDDMECMRAAIEALRKEAG